MIAALIFVLAMSQLFMGMYLVGNEFGLGAEKTILQSCFFGMFFILLFQAALFQRNAKGEKSAWESQHDDPIELIRADTEGKVKGRRRISPGTKQFDQAEQELQANYRARNIKLQNSRNSGR